MTPPLLRTVLTVLSGTSAVRVRVFPWGTPVEPFAVGAQGAWAVSAPGVEPIHFYLGFDGRLVHVASGSAAGRLFIDANPVGQAWVPLPIGAELRFGSARIGATCEELPAAPVGAFGTVLQPGRSEPAPAPKAPVLGFVAVQPVAVHPSLGAAPRTVAIDGARALPAPSPLLQPNPAPLLTQPSALEAPQAPAAMTTAPSARRPLDQARSPSPVTQAGTTVSDEGALRDLAAQVAQAAQGAPPASPIAAEPVVQNRYPAELAPPAPSPPVFSEPPILPAAPFEPAERAPIPGAADGGRPLPASPAFTPGSELPNATTPFPEAGAKKVSPFTKAWKETSWVMKLTLVLLPFAAYFGLFWEPTEEEPEPPSAQVVPVEPPEATAPVRDEAVTETAPQASAAVALAQPLGSAPNTVAPASRAPATEPLPASSVLPSAVSSAEAAAVKPTAPALGAQPREALRLAFEGRLLEAANRYEKLAETSDPRVFSLAARLAREQAVRKP